MNFYRAFVFFSGYSDFLDKSPDLLSVSFDQFTDIFDVYYCVWFGELYAILHNFCCFRQTILSSPNIWDSPKIPAAGWTAIARPLSSICDLRPRKTTGPAGPYFSGTRTSQRKWFSEKLCFEAYKGDRSDIRTFIPKVFLRKKTDAYIMHFIGFYAYICIRIWLFELSS